MRKMLVGLGTSFGFMLSCWTLDPDHCASNMGNASCEDGLYCDACSGENFGCVEALPPSNCYAEHGPDSQLTSSSDSSSTNPPVSTGPSPVDTTVDTTDESTGMTTSDDGCASDGDCSDATPFCGPAGICVNCDGMADADGACAGVDPATPICAEGACVQCTAEQVEACGEQTPACDVNNQCAPCSEHAQCPQTACHLDGDLAGACFDEEEVISIANTMELSTALGQLDMSDRAVFVLEAGNYGITIDVGASIELAVLGGAGVPVVTGNSSSAMDIFGDAIVYLSEIQISNIGGDGLACTGASVWLDDVRVSNNSDLGMDVSSGCFAHVRRSLVVNNDSGGLDMAGGELSVRNAAIGLNGDALTSLIGGLRVDGTTVDISYSTIVGNQAINDARGSIFCAGSGSGVIRNSIITSTGNSIDGCKMLMFESNAVDDTIPEGSNVDVGAAMPVWFVNLGMSDFHLTAAAVKDLADIAMWQENDPIADIDGDPIPIDSASLPGYDQP